MRRRWLLLPPLFLVGLFGAFHAAAAVKDTDAKVKLDQPAPGQYRLNVENTGSTTITSFTFVAGPALQVASVTSPAQCALGAPNTIVCNVMLDPPPCACNPGGAVDVLFAGTGDPAGSKVTIDTKTIMIGAPTTPPPTTTSAEIAKLSARVGPGAKIVFASRAAAGKATITVRDMTAADNFHLTGPGVNKKTGVGFKGTVKWTVTLAKGVYTFRSDAHPKLRGKTTVG